MDKRRLKRSILIVIAIVLVVIAAVFVGFSLKKTDVSKRFTYKLVNTYPHDTEAFTQGLVFEDGVLYEGTGNLGHSELRIVEFQTGNVLEKLKLADHYFGEGITIFKDRIIQLTYQSNTGLVYDKETLSLIRQFGYSTEGWGLTHDGTHLIMSDGTPMLYFLDPETYQQVNRIMVFDDGKPVWLLNELEYIKGEIFANVWPTDRIVRIDPKTGHVLGWIDMKALLTPEERTEEIDVFNGIAYDPETDLLYVTGKYWPKLFEVRLNKSK